VVQAGMESLRYRLGIAGEHMAMNSLGVLAAAQAAGAGLGRAAASLGTLQAVKGRGLRRRIALPAGGALELIDDSYNANPVSMAAAFAVLGQAQPGPGGRRIAILGDMLELGEARDPLHAGLAAPLLAGKADLVFTCGAGMAALEAALPAALKGAHAADSAALLPLV